MANSVREVVPSPWSGYSVDLHVAGTIRSDDEQTSHINCHRRSSEASGTTVCVPRLRKNRVSRITSAIR